MFLIPLVHSTIRAKNAFLCAIQNMADKDCTLRFKNEFVRLVSTAGNIRKFQCKQTDFKAMSSLNTEYYSSILSKNNIFI